MLGANPAESRGEAIIVRRPDRLGGLLHEYERRRERDPVYAPYRRTFAAITSRDRGFTPGQLLYSPRKMHNEEPTKAPTRQEFVQTVREAFAFLRRFGFCEVPPRSHRRREHFQVWFRADQRYVIVSGEGYGTIASVMLEHESGLELPEIDLVPPAHRPGTKGNPRKVQPGQLEQVREAARRLEEYGADFLSGDESRFFATAKPLPPYKRSRV